MNKKEVSWFTGTSLLILIFHFAMFSSMGYMPGSHHSVNIHDAYFVFETAHVILFFTVFFLFGVYLIRCLLSRFKNPTANWILIISTILLILIFSFLNFSLIQLMLESSEWTIYPPLSMMDKVPEPEPVDNTFKIISNLLWIFKILLLIFLTYCGYKTWLIQRRPG